MSWLADRVLETTTTTGTGALSLLGAATGFRTFAAAIGDGNGVYYLIDDGTDWEVGRGTVTAGAPDTLSRDSVFKSTNGDAAVNWGAGTRNVACVLPARLLESLAANDAGTGLVLRTAAHVYATLAAGHGLGFDTVRGQIHLAGFRARAQDTADMTVRVEAGTLPTGVEVAAQNTGTITAPATNPRIDLVYLDRLTGAVGVAAGSEAASPTAPALPAGKLPVALVALTTSTTAIAQAVITDRRFLGHLGLRDAAFEGIGDGLESASSALRVKLRDGSVARNADGIATAHPISAKGTGYTVVAGDRGSLIRCTAAITLTLTAAATLGAGFHFEVRNDSAGAVTVDPDGSETVDGAAALTLNAGETSLLRTDGSNWFSLSPAAGGLRLIETQNPAAQSAVDFIDITGSYDVYKLIGHLVPSADLTSLLMRVSHDNGSNFEATSGDYEWAGNFQNIPSSSAFNGAGSGSDTSMIINNAVAIGGAAGEGIRFEITIYNPGSAALQKFFQWNHVHASTGGRLLNGRGDGLYKAELTAVNAIRLSGAAVTLTGTVSLYGLAK